MKNEPDHKPISLAAMPGILVVLTLGYFFVLHAGRLWEERSDVNWTGEGVEQFYLEVGRAEIEEPMGRFRAGLGLDAQDVVQRDGELYYLPDIEHVTARSFLAAKGENNHVVLRRGGSDAREANPVPAILRFDQDLRSRGVRLVLMPTPSKASFAGPGGVPMRNVGLESILGEMTKHDIPVFDPTPHLREIEKRGTPLFLRTDSHWTPEAMRMTALFLTVFLARESLLSDTESEVFFAGTKEITNSGDLARLLDGGMSARWQETIVVHPVRMHRSREEDPVRWQPDRDSPVLLLGDSFTNVFSLPEMGWGEDAGFAEGLSQSLGFRVDRIARNADGAFSSRQELQQDAGRLRGKEVVVWQFAARELSFGDWKVLPLPADLPQGDERTDPARVIKLEGTIAKVAPVPELTRTPYRQAVMEVHLKDVRGEGALQGEVVLLGLGVDDRIPTAMTKWRTGQQLRVKVVPWREVEERYGRLHRFALEDPEFALIGAVRFWLADDLSR